MNVTRDVIYDLLPAYFAGEASGDTRALIDEFFAHDPEFGRMAARFQKLMKERPQGEQMDAEAEREKRTLERTKARVNLRLAAFMWALGAAFAIGIAMLVPNAALSLRHPGVIIGFVFGAMALGTVLLSWAPHPEYWYALLTEVEPRKLRK